MSRWQVGAIVLLWFVFVGAPISLGCAGRPMPTWAVAGTTLGLPVSSASEPVPNLGYGTGTFADRQRGALGVEFFQGTVFRDRVPLRFITRTMPDPASPAGLAGGITTPFGFQSAQIYQAIALIDIPATTLPAGDYTLKLRRYKDANLNAADLVDEGPADYPIWAVKILAGDGQTHYTPFQTWGGSSPFTLDDAIVSETIPLPKLGLWLPVGTAAATLQIHFPDAKIDVRGALVSQKVGQSSHVVYELVDPDSVRIHYMNPAADASALELVFETTSSSYDDRAFESEFAVEIEEYYDQDGFPLNPPAGFVRIGKIR